MQIDKPTYSRPWEIDIIIYKMRGLGDLWIGTGNESEDLYWPSKRRGQGSILISLGFMSGIVMIYKEVKCYKVAQSTNRTYSLKITRRDDYSLEITRQDDYSLEWMWKYVEIYIGYILYLLLLIELNSGLLNICYCSSYKIQWIII